MRLARITSPFWAPIIVGIAAGLMLWMTGLGPVLGAEGNSGKDSVMTPFVKAEGYAISTPMYVVADIERSMAFYVDALGLSPANLLRGDDGVAFHGELQINSETILMIGLEGASGSPHGVSPNTGGYKVSFNGYFYVSDVDAYVARAVDKGALMIEEPTDQYWGDRTSYLKDPDGYLWMIATKIKAAQTENGEGAE